jgi:hypothetical protein
MCRFYSSLPVSPAGELRLEAHQEYCRKLRKFASVKVNAKWIITPGTYDILLGRGKPLQKHAGNLRYHHVIETYHGRYEKAQKLEKTNLSKLIVQKMKDDGGRFLKQDDCAWIEIDDDAARYKVSHTFRNHRIAARTQEKKTMGKGDENGSDQRRKHEDDSDHSSSEAYTGISVDGQQKRRRVSDVSSTSTFKG